MMLMELKKQRELALSKAESIIATAERANRKMTQEEQLEVDNATLAVKALDPKIQKLERNNSIFKHLSGDGILIPGAAGTALSKYTATPLPVHFTETYLEEFHQYLQSGGTQIGAALYEGSNAAGGFAVPIVVESQIVPLAPNEMSVRRLATVIATSSDIKIPTKTAHGVAAQKAESGASDNAFSETDPTLGQLTLSAFMVGAIHTASFEAVQDITVLQSFIVDDLILSIQQFEEDKFVNGTGSGQAQGVLTGADTTTGVSGVTLDGIYDLVSKLNAVYHPGASFLMNRVCGLAIRKLQRQANLFEPVFTRVGNQDYLLGYPVEYSASMTTDLTTAAGKPIVFGDFKRGFVIGDRGGSGISVKVLDQPKASLGQIQLLAYRRSDSRVRRSEALKAYVLA